MQYLLYLSLYFSIHSLGNALCRKIPNPIPPYVKTDEKTMENQVIFSLKARLLHFPGDSCVKEHLLPLSVFQLVHCI